MKSARVTHLERVAYAKKVINGVQLYLNEIEAVAAEIEETTAAWEAAAEKLG